MNAPWILRERGRSSLIRDENLLVDEHVEEVTGGGAREKRKERSRRRSR